MECSLHQLSDLQSRLDDVLYRKDQNGLQVVVAEINKSKKKVKHLKCQKIHGGWEPIGIYTAKASSELMVLNLTDYAKPLSAKVQIDEEQQAFDF